MNRTAIRVDSVIKDKIANLINLFQPPTQWQMRFSHVRSGTNCPRGPSSFQQCDVVGL
jgi:hypothetical protein